MGHADEGSRDDDRASRLDKPHELFDGSDRIRDVFDHFRAEDSIKEFGFRNVVQITDKVELMKVPLLSVQALGVASAVILSNVLSQISKMLAVFLVRTFARANVQQRLSGGDGFECLLDPDVSGIGVLDT